jgi:translocator protein
MAGNSLAKACGGGSRLIVGAMRALLGFLGLTYGVAALGAGFPPDAWFAQLAKPTWMPPGWVFGAVWTVLYGLIAIAGWKLWRSEPSGARRMALILWSLQLFINALWSPLFFGLHQPLAALIDILILDALLAASFGWFRQVDVLAAWLFVPYVLWVLCATALNVAIVMLN